MNLNYNLLKANVVEVEVKKDLNMGDDSLELLMDATNGLIPKEFAINEKDEVIIPAGTKAKFNVQSANGWYEIEIQSEFGKIHYDVALEDDELNEYIKGLSIIGPNSHFVKEA